MRKITKPSINKKLMTYEQARTIVKPGDAINILGKFAGKRMVPFFEILPCNNNSAPIAGSIRWWQPVIVLEIFYSIGYDTYKVLHKDRIVYINTDFVNLISII